MTSGFGTLALGLAGFGLFGVLSNAVARRTPEFGLRMALGASRRLMVWSVVREALWLVVTGLVIGLPVVFLGGRLISTLLFGVSPFDSLSVIAATLVLVSVGGLSAPCRHSARPGSNPRMFVARSQTAEDDEQGSRTCLPSPNAPGGALPFQVTEGARSHEQSE